jgi:DNA repair photolyase
MIDLINIIKAKGRYFIDVTIDGCGSGCSYCYIKNPKKEQKLMERNLFNESIDQLVHDRDFEVGKRGSIISLCPNTEPFKSKNSTISITDVLRKFLPLGNPIQISTKEVIPVEFLQFTQNNVQYEKQVFFNISVPCITNANKIEPNAAKIENRLKNFVVIKKFDRLSSCLYIKPFLHYSYNDIDHYLEIITNYEVEYVCVGLYLKKKSWNISYCDLLYQNNDMIKKIIDLTTIDKLNKFKVEILKRTNAMVFHTSIDIIHYILKTRSSLSILQKIPQLN